MNYKDARISLEEAVWDIRNRLALTAHSSLQAELVSQETTQIVQREKIRCASILVPSGTYTNF